MSVFNKAVFVRVLEAGSVFTPDQVRALGDALEVAPAGRYFRNEPDRAVALKPPAPPQVQ